MKKIVIVVIVLGVLVGGFVYSTLTSGLNAVDIEDSEEIAINIPEASTTDKIAEILYEKDLIKNKFAFKYQVKKNNVASKLKAGNYLLSRDMDATSIIDKLIEGADENTVRFTIPEGYELRQISDKLSGEGIIDSIIFDELVADKSNFEDEFEFLKQLDDGQSLEGFLFPATYEIFKGESEEDIIKRMLTAFEKVYEEDLKEKISDSELSFNEIITLASIIEREGKLDEERPLMSAVFYNRLDQNMRLGSCATVQYILGERKEILSNADTQIDSPFNTYINDGLPPAPIAAAGKVSLIAAVEPADVDYLYFVLTGEDGSHTFTTNYDDHLKAKSGND